MCKSSDEKSSTDDAPKTLDAPTLFFQHSWRLAFIIASLSLAIKSVLSSSTVLGYSGSILALLFCLIWFKSEVVTIHRRSTLPPGDLGYPIVGETLSFFLNPSSYGKLKQEKFGDMYTENTISLGVVLGHHVDIAWLWNSERKGRAQGMWPPHIRALLGKGAVANTSGQQHRMLRRMLEPAFTPNATRDYVNVLDQATQDSLKKWASVDSFHSSSEFKMFALRLFFIAGFGSVDEEMIHRLHDDFTIWLNGFGSLVPLRIPGTLFHQAMRARERILETVEILVQKFKQENPPGSEGRAQASMMGRVCYGTDEQGKPMNPETLNDNVLNMIFAGHDTTYASMGTALHYLSQYPDVLDALTKEVQSFQDPLSFDELKNAPLLNAFLAESWRMDPPVAGAFRELKKDTEYKGYKLSKDMVIRYNILAASQNDDLYPSPLTFEIQRYLPKDHPLVVDSSLEAQGVDYNNLKANYPIFGGGAHGCLGSHFAKLEMRVLLARLLQNFKLEVRNSEKVHFPVNGWKNEFRLTKK